MPCELVNTSTCSHKHWSLAISRVGEGSKVPMLRSLRVDSSCIGAALAVLLCLNLLQLGYLFSSHRSCSDRGTGKATLLDGHRSAATGSNGGSKHSRMAISSTVR